MAEKNRTIVRIAGREYTLVSTDSDETMQKAALLVNRKMAEVYRLNTKLSTVMAAILTSLNLADELLKSGEQIARLTRDMEVFRKEREALAGEAETTKTECKALAETLAGVRLDLARKEAELNTIRTGSLLK